MGDLYKLAKGTVRLEVSGAEPEKLLNFLAENGIEFWDVSPKNDFSVLFTINAQDAPEVFSRSGRNGMEIRLVSSRGGRELGRALKRRLAFCIGLCLCITVLAVSSLFVWSIETEGNDKISDAALLRELAGCGVEYGAFWPALSSDKVRDELLIKMPQIAWLSVNVHNSRVKVVVHERIEKPEIVSAQGYADILAEKSGVITKLTVLEGRPNVAVGDTVLRGDVLISGSVMSETAQERRVHALGSATARTWYEISARVPLFEEEKSSVKHKKTTWSLVIGKNRIKFFGDSRNKAYSCDKIEKLKRVSAGDAFMLPVGILKERRTEYEIITVPIDRQETAERLKGTLREELLHRIDGGEIVSTAFSVSEDEQTLTVTLRAECLEEIGVSYDREND